MFTHLEYYQCCYYYILEIGLCSSYSDHPEDCQLHILQITPLHPQQYSEVFLLHSLYQDVKVQFKIFVFYSWEWTTWLLNIKVVLLVNVQILGSEMTTGSGIALAVEMHRVFQKKCSLTLHSFILKRTIFLGAKSKEKNILWPTYSAVNTALV